MNKEEIIKDWNEIDDMVKDMMQEYPLLFPSRVECWIHLFGCIGTGYSWDLEAGKLVYWQERKEMTEARLEEVKEEDNDLIVFQKQRTNLLRQHVWDNIEVAALDYHHCNTERNITSVHTLHWSEPNKQYFMPGIMQQACINKEKIAKVWRYEISYFCKWIKSQVHQFVYSPNPDRDAPMEADEIIALLEPCRKIRKMSEMLSAFKTAVKVLDNIFLPEEIKQHEENHKRMMEWTDQMIKDMKKKLAEEDK